MNYQWDFEVVWESLPVLLQGLQVSVVIAVSSMIIGSLVGLGIALLRIAEIRILSGLAAAYVEVFRNTPVITQLLWVYYVLPIMTGLQISAFGSALVAFSLNVGAFAAEIFRAGILSVPKGQTEAAIAIGLTPSQVFRRVIGPQALQNVLPALASIWLSLFKDSSIASVVSVAEMMYEARALAAYTYRPVEIFTVAGLLYFTIVYVQSLAIEHLYERWLRRARRGGGDSAASEPAAVLAKS
jgi:polar amino acid transport system permease protein